MRVAFIKSAFVETFGANDVRALVRAGVRVGVHNLRVAPKGIDAVLQARGVGEVPVTWNGPLASLKGLAFGVKHPHISANLLRRIAALDNRDHQVRSLVLAPRALGIFREVRNDQVDVVHLFWGHFPSMVAVLTEEYLPHVVTSMFLGAYDLGYGYELSAVAAQKADVVFTHAQANVAQLVAMGVPADKIRVVYRGIDFQRYNDAYVPAPNQNRVIWVGRLNDDRRIDQAIMVVERVREQFPDANLTVVGDGPSRAEYEAFARARGATDWVSFLGNLPHDQVFSELTGADVVLSMCRSPTERLPNALKEAMMCRRPVVATATVGMDELMVDGQTGYIVPLDDVDAAAERVTDLLGDADRRLAFAHAGHARLVEAFDLDEVIRQTMAHWTSAQEAKP